MWSLKISEFIPPIVFRASNYIGRRIRLLAPHDQVKFPPFDNLPRNLDVKWVLDVGANVGDVAVHALESYKDCNVICFEPVEETYTALTKRLSGYGSRARTHKLALSDKAGTGEINITTSHGANSIEAQAPLHKDFNPTVREIRKEAVQLVTLDQLSESFPPVIFDVMKVDVEGHELNVLKGGLNFISANVRYLIIEVSLVRDQHHDNQAIYDIFSIMKSAGFAFQNAFDFHRADNEGLLVQMDCIFKNGQLSSKS